MLVRDCRCIQARRSYQNLALRLKQRAQCQSPSSFRHPADVAGLPSTARSVHSWPRLCVLLFRQSVEGHSHFVGASGMLQRFASANEEAPAIARAA